MTHHARRIDALMDLASRELVATRYFEAQRHAQDALAKAHAARDYERMARIILPLQEARRQIRDLALDTGNVVIIRENLPLRTRMQPGCYLVCPPRVGVDGRELRDRATRRQVPVVIVVREPTTREGLWPIVAVGPATVRTKVTPPPPLPHLGPAVQSAPGPGSAAASAKRSSTSPARRSSSRTRARTSPEPDLAADPCPPPTPEWFVAASEALGDVAIAQLAGELRPDMRVDGLMARLATHPDHEKLHQALRAACELAHATPATLRPKAKVAPDAQPIADDDE